ncbi:MAG TPA: hypothetical protein PLX49_13815, partial [Prolixibacteraceae bacterium]|nr:hypothetical protein [Prolixibacteraceae bacterium]
LTAHEGDVRYQHPIFTGDGRRGFVLSDHGREAMNLALLSADTPLAGAPTSTMALGAQTGAFQSALSGLSTNTAYAFAFQSSNAGGVAWSATNTFTTYSTPWFLNARFEDNGPFYNTTANTFKTPVTNWTLTGGGSKGIAYTTNTGDAYTANTGYKSQIAGLLVNGGLSQTVSNFIPGQLYVIVWEGNSRPGYGDGGLRISVDGRIIWGDTCILRSGGFLTYTSKPFRASSGSLTLQFEKATGGDATLLDNLRILPTTNPVAPFVDAIATASSGGGIAYTSVDPGYGVTPYEGFSQLRMQMIGSYTMTLRELRGGWRTEVSFYARNRTGQQNPCRFSVDGTVYLGSPTYTIPGNAWTNQTFTFVATGSTASLTFETFSATDQTVFFDGWTVTSLQPTMPGIMVQVN